MPMPMPMPGGAPPSPPGMMGGGVPGMPPGGAPPGPPGGTGGASVPSGMLGNQQAGMTSVKVGLEALQKALPSLPMGSELHNAVLKAVSDIAKHFDTAGPQQSGDVLQQLAALARAQHTQPQQAALGSMFPASPPPGGGGGGAGGAPALAGA